MREEMMKKPGAESALQEKLREEMMKRQKIPLGTSGPGRVLQSSAPNEEDGGLKPLRLAFGSMSLVVGVLLICLVHIIIGIFIIAICTSVGSIQLVGIEIPPWKQIVGATWMIIGMPLIIQGGVGALYRIPTPVMTYFYYLAATCVLDLAFLISISWEASLCTSVVPKDFVEMGPNFVCGITDALLFVGFTLFGLIFMYFCFIVWSCAQEITGWKPALLDKMREEYEEEEEYYEPEPAMMPQGYPGYPMPAQYPSMQPMMPPMMPGGYSSNPGSFPAPMKTHGGMPAGGPYGSMSSQPPGVSMSTPSGFGAPRPSMPYK